MKKDLIQPVVLCGGSGSRLWPLSRSGFPKQFLVLSGTTSLFQQALERVLLSAPKNYNLAKTLVVTNEEHRFLAQEQCREIIKTSEHEVLFLLEPVGRNTAPALTFAAFQAIDGGQDPILIVTPADQTIRNILNYKKALESAIQIASGGGIVILGITPTQPETGYGYIKISASKDLNKIAYPVEKFVEKPSLELAKQYFESGNYFWNAGMFVVRASVWIDAMAKHRRDILDLASKAFDNKTIDNEFIRPDRFIFSEIYSESIDYAVIEKCSGSELPLNVVPLDAGWSDLGAWDAVWKAGEPDFEGNVLKGDTLVLDSSNSLVYASDRLVSVLGLSDIVVVETADAVLVTNKECSQDVKKIISNLELQNREEKSSHRKVSRPWGWYNSLDEGERFKVKRIQVKPGASLSLQMHHHRAEHWIVVKGIAEITNGEKVIVLNENQGTYIPKGQIHRLKNLGVEPLEIIEVQTGVYLGEDDIVRLEDSYGRL